MKKVLVIAPKNSQKNLLSFYRKENVFTDVKMMSREELYHSVYSSFDKNHLMYLYAQTDMSYDFLSSIISFFPYVEDRDYCDASLNQIVQYKKIALQDHNESKPFYPNLVFKDREVHVYYYDKDDFYLSYVFNLYNVKADFKTLDNKLQPMTLHHFRLADDEVLYVLNNIAGLLNEGETNIHLVLQNDSYRYILNKYAPYFNIKINNLIDISLSSKPICQDFLKYYQDYQDILEATSKISEIYFDNEYLGLLLNTIDINTYNYLTFEKQLVVFKKAFENVKISSSYYEGGVDLIDSPTFCDKDHVFFLGFSQDDFPKFYKEASFINADQKTLISYPTALIQNKVADSDLNNFLRCGSHIHLSFSEHVNNEIKYPSLLVNDPDYLIETDDKNEVETYYSQYYCYIKFCKSLDKLYKYLEYSEDYETLNRNTPEFNSIYKSFDYQITPITIDNPSYDMYYTAATEFMGCQYAYFVDHILNIEDPSTSFNASLGSFAHSIFQHCYKDGKLIENLDFDRLYEDCKKGIQFSNSEMLLVDHKIKNFIKNEIDYLSYQDSKFVNPTYYTEKYLNHLNVEGSKIKLTGKIDKTIIINNKYLYFVDYKSSETIFKEEELRNGKSLQLATYLLGCDSIPEFKNFQVCGFFYSQFIPSSLKDGASGPSNYSKFRGRIIDDKMVTDLFDRDEEFVYSTSRNKAERDPSEFETYKETAKETYRYISDEIENNSYPIDPNRNGAKDACKWCAYKDICYYTGLDEEKDEDEEEENDELY